MADGGGGGGGGGIVAVFTGTPDVGVARGGRLSAASLLQPDIC